jgi:hypothetical protein
VLISANRILTSRRNTWLISLNILKRSTVSLNLASSESININQSAYLTAEATRLERALTQPLETDNLDDLSLEPALEPSNIAPAATPKEKQPAKRKSPNKTTTGTEGMHSQNFLMVSCSIFD